MRKIITFILALICIAILAFPCVAEQIEPAAPTIQQAAPSEPFSWEYLATIGGAAALTLLICQFLKVPLDHVWRIPTRLLAYLIALVIIIIATACTTGLTPSTALMAFVNAFLAALSAYGSYELTFAKLEH